MAFPSDHHQITSFLMKGYGRDIFQHHQITSFLLKGYRRDFFQHHQITSFLLKGFFHQPIFRRLHHQLSPVLSPVFLGVKPLILMRKQQSVTKSPVLQTSLPYISRKNTNPKIFLAHSVTLIQKTGDLVMRLLNALEWQGNSRHQLLVMTGDTGDAVVTLGKRLQTALARSWQ